MDNYSKISVYIKENAEAGEENDFGHTVFSNNIYFCNFVTVCGSNYIDNKFLR